MRRRAAELVRLKDIGEEFEIQWKELPGCSPATEPFRLG